jgi:hypothetical protein
MTATTKDRIETYIEEKHRIVGCLERSLDPLFSGLITELRNAAQDLVGPLQDPEKWCREMMEVLCAPGPHYFGSLPSTVTGVEPLKDILNAYAAGADIALLSTFMMESGMDQDEVNLSFECGPWQALLKAELGSTAVVPAGCFIWLLQPGCRDSMGVYLRSLFDFELADLRTIERSFDEYWDGALTWAKLRRSDLE